MRTAACSKCGEQFVTEAPQITVDPFRPIPKDIKVCPECRPQTLGDNKDVFQLMGMSVASRMSRGFRILSEDPEGNMDDWEEV